MKAVKKIEISVLHKRITPIVYAVQGDTGREIECTVVDWDIPAGVTARIWVVKPSKKVVYNDCRIVDKAVFVPMTNQTLAEPGGAICMIEFVSGEDVVSSFSFNLYVYESASGDGIPSENESTVLEGMFEELAQDAIKTLNEAKAQAAAAKKSAQDTEKIKNDFTLTAQQATADVNNAGQAQTQRVNTAGDTQVSRIQAEGTTQVQNVQDTAAEISADREQIHTNRDNTARLQRNSAGAVTRSTEGSFVTLEDAADEMGFRQLEIPGMTVQRTTTGAQLLNLPDVENAISNGLTYSIKNGVVTASGTPTVEYASIVAKKIKLPPGNYYASGIDTTSGRLFLQMAITSADGNKTFYSNKGFTIDGTEQSIDYVIQIGSNITALSKCTLYPLLNAGSAALPWEPYTGNKPSPSPEYPQEMENVGVQREDGKFKVKVTACKNNMLDMSGAKGGTDAGITATVNPDGSYTSNGTVTNGAINIWLLGGYYPDFTDKDVLMVLAPGKTYCLADVALFMGTENTATQVFFVDPKKYPKGFKVTGVRHPAKNVGTVLTNKTHYPRVILGDTDTGWEPYRGHTATITSDRPLTKWDKLTFRDGVWGWAYKGTKYICILNEVISQHGASIGKKYPCMTFSMKGKARDAGEVCACNYLKSVGSEVLNGNAIGIWGNTNPTYKNYVYIGIPYSVLGTTIDSTADENTAAMTAWLNAKKEAGAPVTIEYQLAEEEWVPLTDREQAAMNALCTHAGTTHIWTDDPLQPVISLDYTVDTEGYIRDTTPAYRDVEKFALTGEASGTVATCTDSAEWPLLGVGMLGKCEQLTTTGANLLNVTAQNTTISGLNFTIKENGMIEANGTTDNGAQIILGYISLKPGTYFLSGNQTIGSEFYLSGIFIYDKGQGALLQINEEVKNTAVYWYFPKGNYTNAKIKPMINIGNAALPWEPYTGAAPSPSPAYKQEIQETGTYNPETGMYEADMVMTGSNLFNPKTLTYKSYVNDVTGAIASNAGDVNASDYIPVTGYKYVKITTTTASKQWGAFYDSSKKYISGIISYKNPVPVPTNASYMRLTVIDDAIDAFMVNAGEVALPWEPYQSDTLRLTADQPWRGTGDIHDEVCDRDGVLGTWRRFEAMEYNTAASHFANPLKKTKELRITPPQGALLDSKKKTICDKFRNLKDGTWNKDVAYVYGDAGVNGEYIAFRVGINENPETFFVDNPIKFVYQLAEPYFEPFPEEIQKQYRKLKSYAGTTHAWVDDPLQPEVSFRYIKDSKLILSKLEDRLTALEAGQAQTAAAFSYLPPETQAAMIENETRDLLSTIQEEEK